MLHDCCSSAVFHILGGATVNGIAPLILETESGDVLIRMGVTGLEELELFCRFLLDGDKLQLEGDAGVLGGLSIILGKNEGVKALGLDELGRLNGDDDEGDDSSLSCLICVTLNGDFLDGELVFD